MYGSILKSNRFINLICISIFFFSSSLYATADKILTITTSDDTDIDVRILKAMEISSFLALLVIKERVSLKKKTAKALAKDGIEVWMP